MKKQEITVSTVFSDTQDVQQLFIDLIINRRHADSMRRLHLLENNSAYECECGDEEYEIAS